VGVLGAIYLSNFLDRSVINILAQYIKEDLQLSDTQLGVLGGIAFAALYAVLGIPIARLAERFNRVAIISVALACWSVMTCLCGAAGTFWQLFLARVGVGIGEAGCTPSAHSLIADLFPPNRRASAFSAYGMGVPIGALLGVVGGAWLGQHFGWRAAFVAVGAPGLALALLTFVTLREPPRGRFDADQTAEPPPLRKVVTTLFREPAFVHLVFGMTICTFGLAGMQAFLTPMILRGDYGVDLTELALIVAPVAGAASIGGTGAGGFLADWAAKRRPGAHLWLPGLGFCVAAALYMSSIYQSRIIPLAAFQCAAQFFAVLYIGPSFAVIHNLASPRMRASAIAVVYLVVNMIGTGLGPVAAGMLSDAFGAHAYGDLAAWNAECLHGSALAACRSASFEGARQALVVMSSCLLWAGAHYLRGGTLLGRGDAQQRNSSNSKLPLQAVERPLEG
jgi:predicted MFS family arabinose efflux permease